MQQLQDCSEGNTAAGLSSGIAPSQLKHTYTHAHSQRQHTHRNTQPNIVTHTHHTIQGTGTSNVWKRERTKGATREKARQTDRQKSRRKERTEERRNIITTLASSASADVKTCAKTSTPEKRTRVPIGENTNKHKHIRKYTQTHTGSAAHG